MTHTWMYARKKLPIVSVVETIGGKRIFSLFECFANHLSQGKNKMSFRVYQFKRRGASMLRVLSVSSSVIPTTVEKAIMLNNLMGSWKFCQPSDLLLGLHLSKTLVFLVAKCFPSGLISSKQDLVLMLNYALNPTFKNPTWFFFSYKLRMWSVNWPKNIHLNIFRFCSNPVSLCLLSTT